MTMRTLKAGMAGADVKAVQEALSTWKAKPELVRDGKFGSNTDKAVRNFQETKGLKPDGAVGPKTRLALFPVGVATVSVLGMRRKTASLPSFRGESPSLGVGRLSLNSSPADQTRSLLDHPSMDLLKLPRLAPYIWAPRVPDLTLTMPSTGSSPSAPFGFVYDHRELQPGAQTTLLIDHARQDAFILTMQTIYRRGPDKGAHLEAPVGVQMGTPISSFNGPWTFQPFVQLTDVDRMRAVGPFHWWQPYAQAGFQIQGAGPSHPTLTAGLFPVNLGLDIGDVLNLSLAGGLALNLDLQTGKVQAGPQFSFGLTLKFGTKDGPL